MSMTGKSSFHRKKDSEELAVFEASRYFSGYNELSPFAQQQRATRGGGARLSLDMPMRHALISPARAHKLVEKQIIKEHKKYKHPITPGAKFARFFNSLFSQTGPKKKKSEKDHEEDNRKKRRNSISNDSKSFYSPPHTKTPPKGYNSYLDHKQLPATTIFKNSDNVIGEVKSYNNGKLEIWVDRRATDKREIRALKHDQMRMDDDGTESDSSSDLFELENYDLGRSCGGLPVYQTTIIAGRRTTSGLLNF